MRKRRANRQTGPGTEALFIGELPGEVTVGFSPSGLACIAGERCGVT